MHIISLILCLFGSIFGTQGSPRTPGNNATTVGHPGVVGTCEAGGSWRLHP